MLQVNNYPPCPLLERCLGHGSHTDPPALTIFLHGGLQVQKHNREWIDIRSIANSFIVNIGDMLEVRIQPPIFYLSLCISARFCKS